MAVDEEAYEKSKVEREHLKRVKEQMIIEEKALKATRVVKGADTKKYKKFKDGYIPPPELELPDEVKLTIARNYQALNGFMGLVGLGMIFFIIYHPPLHLSILENSVIALKIYNSVLYLSILENYFLIETNLILLGCALVAANIIGIIYYQHKHDKISDRIRSGRSIRGRLKKARRKYHGLIRFAGVLGIGIIFLAIYYLEHYISVFENFIIALSIYDSTLHLLLFKSTAIKINLILLGCALAVASAGIIYYRHRQTR